MTPQVFTADDFREIDVFYCGRIAHIANALLSQRSQVVWDVADGNWSTTQYSCHTKTALLVGVQPIVRDTAESLLRELCDALEHTRGGLAPWAPALDRARKLLERGE